MIRFLIALGSIALGGFIVIYVIAFAGMVNPGLSATERYYKICDKIFTSGSVIPFSLGLALISLGAYLLFQLGCALLKRHHG